MTLKDFINEAMDLAQILLNRGDHNGYRQCMEMIADAIYETLEATYEIAEAHDEVTEA